MVSFVFETLFHLKGTCNIQKMWLKIALVNIGSVLCFDASKNFIDGQIVIMSNTMRLLRKGIYVPYYPL